METQLQLHQIRRLKELTKENAYLVAQLRAADIKPVNDFELLQLLEITVLQKDLSDAVNAFLARDVGTMRAMITMGLGALCHMSSQLAAKGSELLGSPVRELADPFIELFKDNIIESEEKKHDRP